MKSILKKNQAIIFVITLMLIAAGYLNFSANNGAISTSSSINEEEHVASIGDAQLVNANVIEEASLVSNNENEEVETNAKLPKEEDYFSGSRIERDTMYSQMLDTYQKMISSDNVSQDQKNIAQNEITKINEQKNAIMIAENLLKTKGFEDLIIFMNGKNVNIIVKAEKLEKEQIAQIQNIITRELNVNIEDIHITNRI